VATAINRAVFLDRDGVINKATIREGKPYPPASEDEFEFLLGVPEAINNLHRAGFFIIVVTNQPDVRTGLQEQSVVEAMHRKIETACPIDEISVCYHVDRDNCICRKPKPGMLFEAARNWDLNLSQSYMVGDRWRDIGAGKAAGCATILIDNEYEEQRAENPDAVVDSLLEASNLILSSAL